jgi:hypothetical protein
VERYDLGFGKSSDTMWLSLNNSYTVWRDQATGLWGIRHATKGVLREPQYKSATPAKRVAEEIYTEEMTS